MSGITFDWDLDTLRVGDEDITPEPVAEEPEHVEEEPEPVEEEVHPIVPELPYPFQELMDVSDRIEKLTKLGEFLRRNPECFLEEEAKSVQIRIDALKKRQAEHEAEIDELYRGAPKAMVGDITEGVGMVQRSIIRHTVMQKLIKFFGDDMDQDVFGMLVDNSRAMRDEAFGIRDQLDRKIASVLQLKSGKVRGML